MKRNVVIWNWICCLIWVLAAGCSHSEEDADVPKDKDVKTRLLTFTQVENKGSRAVLKLNEVDQSLSALWKKGDKLKCCNLTTLEEDIITHKTSTGTLTAQDNNVATSIFQGTINCGKDHQLAVIYPVTDFGSELVSGEYYAKYTITLSGQDGRLETLASNYHYMYGVASVNCVTGTTAEATGNMKSLLAVCKFWFKDENDNIIHVKELEICLENDGIQGNIGTYPQTANVTCNTNPDAVHALAVKSNEPLIIQTVLGSDSQYPTDVYVALLPVSDRTTFRFNVKDASGNTYIGVANATLSEGEFVIAQLSLNKVPAS